MNIDNNKLHEVKDLLRTANEITSLNNPEPEQVRAAAQAVNKAHDLMRFVFRDE